MQTSHLLLAAAVLATVSLVVSGQANFSFYKLSLQWPPAVCNASSFRCHPTILSNFTIHGLWPQYANDTPVPPYHRTRNNCTNIIPTSPNEIPRILQPIRDNLTRLWPNLKNYTNLTMNEAFWKYEWRKHGMCSDYPGSPRDYFNAALSLATNYTNLLQGMSITPNQTNLYPAKNISEAIRDQVGRYPEISCKNVSGILQLMEIRLCFKREKPPIVIRNCPKNYSNSCSNDTDQIRFPPPPATSYF